jgi:PKD repeat protein
VSGGDGAFCFIDQTNSNNQISSYVYNNYYKSTDATNFSTLSGSNSTGDFINPGDLDGVNDILYTKGGSDILSRWTSVFGSPTRTNITLTGVSGITHIKVSPNTPTTVYIGTSGGAIYKITGANTITSPYSPTAINTAFGGRISSIDIRIGSSDDTMLVTQSNYGLGNSVLITNNSAAGSPTWTDIDDNSTLPDIPINWGLMSPTYSSKVVLATEMGIYTCNDIYASPAVWGQSVTGLANVRVDMLKMRMADSLILAATHGRGLYTCDIFTTAKADFGADKVLAYVGESIQFTDDSYRATSYAWDFNNDGVTDATTQNPTYAFGTGGYKTIKLIINGTVEKIRTDYIQVLPNMAVPYTASDGGNFDDDSKAFHFGSKVILGTINLWERGVPSNYLTTVNSGTKAWKTDLDADITNGTYQCALYSPNFNFTSTSSAYTLSFKKSQEIYYSNAPSAAQMQYSIDKGISWTRLGVNGSGTNWYNRYPSSSPLMSSSVFSDQYGWMTTVNNETTSYDVSFLNGNANVSFRLVFSVAGGYSGSPNPYAIDGFMVDDFTISGPSNSATSAEIETAVSEQTQPLGANATVDYYSPNGKYLATLKNNLSHDYGNTKVEIDNAGTGTLDFNTNTAKGKRILQKTIKITPTNANGSGDVDITMYFSATEIDSFQTHYRL